jgi:hypothetical protein
MGTVLHKKKNVAIIEKGIYEYENGQKYKIGFAGDKDDFVVISHPDEEKKEDESIKDILKDNKNEIHDICFINDYSYLLVGCNKGLLYVYKRIINNKANLKFEEITHFNPHKESIIQITKLQSGHILTLSSDSSSKILEIEIDSNGVLYQNEHKCEIVQLLLEENEPSNNSAIELESGNLIISQGYFINFFEKIKNNNGNGKEFHLTKKILTNSNNISFVEIDNKTVVASQVSEQTLQFYNMDNYSLVNNINKIEFNDMKNSMCLISKETLAIAGKKGSIYLINLIRKQLFVEIPFDNCNHISCIKSIDNDTIIMGCQYWDTNYDVIVYKINNYKFKEIKRCQKAHNGLINDIKLITMNISKNKNPFTEKYNVITLGFDYRAKVILDKIGKNDKKI